MKLIIVEVPQIPTDVIFPCAVEIMPWQQVLETVSEGQFFVSYAPDNHSRNWSVIRKTRLALAYVSGHEDIIKAVKQARRAIKRLGFTIESAMPEPKVRQKPEEVFEELKATPEETVEETAPVLSGKSRKQKAKPEGN